MFFLRKSILQNYILSKKISSSLPFNQKKCSLSAARNVHASLGRAALCISGNMKGSLTVEAAMTLPVFLFLCIGLVFFMEIFALHSDIQGSLYRAAREIAQEMSVLKEGEKLMETESALRAYCVVSARQKVLQYSKDELENNNCLSCGSNGLVFAFLNVDDDMVDVIVKYYVKIPYFSGFDVTFPIVQRCRIRGWTGISKLEEATAEKIKVYIAENGTVYHKSGECTYLKLTIRLVNKEELKDSRNNSGGKYYPCSKCAPNGLE